MSGKLKDLQMGQIVRFTVQDFGYRIHPQAEGGTGCTVILLGSDYVILENEAEGVRTRIPEHLILSVGPETVPAPQAA